jgi:3-methyl-2-oxobutanoate hydroxymethyltransferase
MKRTEKISVLTAYDYSTARICDRAGIDILLVGDSAGMVVLGYTTTMPVGMQEMIIFCGAVARGAKRAMIVGDMPFGSYQPGASLAVENAVQGYKLQGRTKEAAIKLIEEANVLEKAGVFSIVLEMVATEVADAITKSVSIPTIGIGSGPSCDGQVLVLHDMLGIYQDIQPRFVKRYTELSKSMFDAVSDYNREVKDGMFPEESNTFHMNTEELEKWKNKRKR